MEPYFVSLEAMRSPFFLVFTLSLLLAVPTAGCGVARSREPKPKIHQAAKTFAVRYLVKLTPAAGEVFTKAGGRRTLKPEELPVEPLKGASEARKISFWRPVYPDIIESDAVGLNRMYLLIADEETNMRDTLTAFEALTDWIEYIEPGEQLDS